MIGIGTFIMTFINIITNYVQIYYLSVNSNEYGGGANLEVIPPPPHTHSRNKNRNYANRKGQHVPVSAKKAHTAVRLVSCFALHNKETDEVGYSTGGNHSIALFEMTIEKVVVMVGVAVVKVGVVMVKVGVAVVKVGVAVVMVGVVVVKVGVAVVMAGVVVVVVMVGVVVVMVDVVVVMVGVVVVWWVRWL
jgi:hypothetical protein